ncbi:MAG: hypothetical protein ABI592_14230 [Acidobacteriota bacterium]
MNGAALYEETQGFGPWMFAVAGLVILLVAALGTLRMKTTVSADGVQIRYGFLSTTRVPLRDIAKAQSVVYSPVRDYGGWGIRGFGRRRALNARGNQGVLLVRTDGSTLLVGSQRPRDLLSALSRAGVATEDKLPPDIREF